MSKLQTEIQETRYSSGQYKCPFCHDDYIVKNGKAKGNQRYFCRNCDKSFSQQTQTPTSYSKKETKVWIDYIQCMIKGYSLRQCAWHCNINLATAFFWRHKILDAELNYVCELDGKIVGHIFYTNTKVIAYNNVIHSILSFGPISVHPDLQRTGIGSNLIQKTMKLATKMGFGGIVITGNPKYYHRFGFKSASDFEIVFEDGTSSPELMAIELFPGGLASVNGRMYFAPKFSDIDFEKLAMFDAQFPIKEKKRLQGQLW